jgi:solute carrier family 25 phosphate transporter 23/24/25/41
MNTGGAKLSPPSILKEASRVLREEGIRAFWKGNGVTIVHRLPYSSINFFAYEQYKMTLRRILGIEGNKESLGVGMGTRLLAGGGAGITAASLTYPLDLVRTRLAAQVRSLHFVMFKVEF